MVVSFLVSQVGAVGVVKGDHGPRPPRPPGWSGSSAKQEGRRQADQSERRPAGWSGGGCLVSRASTRRACRGRDPGIGRPEKGRSARGERACHQESITRLGSELRGAEPGGRSAQVGSVGWAISAPGFARVSNGECFYPSTKVPPPNALQIRTIANVSRWQYSSSCVSISRFRSGVVSGEIASR